MPNADERADRIIRAAWRAHLTLVAMLVSLGVTDDDMPWWVVPVWLLALIGALVGSFAVILDQERWQG